MAEAMEKTSGVGGGPMWVPVVSAVLSGAVSGIVGFWLGKREKPCACKANLAGNANGNGNGSGNGGKQA